MKYAARRANHGAAIRPTFNFFPSFLFLPFLPLLRSLVFASSPSRRRPLCVRPSPPSAASRSSPAPQPIASPLHVVNTVASFPPFSPRGPDRSLSSFKFPLRQLPPSTQSNQLSLGGRAVILRHGPTHDYEQRCGGLVCEAVRTRLSSPRPDCALVGLALFLSSHLPSGLP